MSRHLTSLLLLSAIAIGPLAQAQIISTVAGTGSFSFSGDGVPATTADLNDPRGVAADGAGNIYIADYSNARIRKVNTSGIISTVAGSGSFGFSGDGGPATAAALNNPSTVISDAAGNIYFSDEGNNRVRKISTSGIITTVAGDGWAASSGDGGAATAASIYTPSGIAIDATGNLYVAEAIGHRIRKVNASGIISTIAGNGIGGFAGDGGPATASQLANPWSLALDAAGNLYICDGSNNRIRKISTSGIITTIAGTGTAAYSGDGGIATLAQLNTPTGIAIDAAGYIYIGESVNHRVRRINTSGIITTAVGTGTSGFSGDGGLATAANIGDPMGLCLDATGDLYIADRIAERVRMVTACVLPVSGTVSGPLSVCTGATITLSTTGSGGSWSSGSPGIATVNTSGIVTGVSAGTVIISYAAVNSCGSSIDTQMIRVNAAPSGMIVGPDTLCVNGTAGFAETAAGGTWTSSNTAVASIASSGSLTALSAGTTVISYVVSNACGTTTNTHALFVKSLIACTPASGVATESAYLSPVIFPNPSNGDIVVLVPAQLEGVTITILDPLGRIVAERSLQGNDLEQQFHIIAKGTYYVKIVANGAVNVQKVVIR